MPSHSGKFISKQSTSRSKPSKKRVNTAVYLNNRSSTTILTKDSRLTPQTAATTKTKAENNRRRSMIGAERRRQTSDTRIVGGERTGAERYRVSRVWREEGGPAERAESKGRVTEMARWRRDIALCFYVTHCRLSLCR